MTANRICFFDTETQTHVYFGAKASPRHPLNYVVASGWAIDEAPYSGAVQGMYLRSQEESSAANWAPFLDDPSVWLVVMHNAPFDVDWLMVHKREQFQAYLKRGGRIFCTAYAEYLLTNQQVTYPPLNETAPKYGGTHKVDGVKLLWEQGVQTSDIDKELLYDEYLIGPEGDIVNTRLTFWGQYQQLVERGMWDMALLRMEGMLYNCHAMNAGLHIDRDVAFKQKAEQEAALASLHEGMSQYRAHIPDYVEFKDSSDYHMSAWLYGGPIKFRQRDTWFEDDGVTPKYENVDCFKFGEGDGIYVPVADFEGSDGAALFQARAIDGVDRYKAGKNKGQPKVHKVKSDVPKQKWYDRQIQLQGIVPMHLLPKDIIDGFKDDFAGKRKLADDTPVYSTGADAIEMLSKRQEFDEGVRKMLRDLLAAAKIDKDLGTYYLRDKADAEGNVVKQSGMLQYLCEHNVVYHVLNSTSTVTTRLSGTRPNMQNIPRGDTSDVKNMFTSRYDDILWLNHARATGQIQEGFYRLCLENIANGVPNGAIIESDYSALEVVTLAAFSKDQALIDALLAGTDMHCLRLSKKLGEDYESVLKKCKDEDHPEHKAYKTMRTDIKAPSFAYQYGATARGIAFATGCTVEYAEQFIETEKALFPDVERWYTEDVFAKVEASTTRHREQVGEAQYRMYGKGVWVSPSGTHYEFRQYPKNVWADGQKHEVMQYKPTQMRNYPIQGESGFFVQGIAGQVVRWLISRDFFDGRVFIINQVHDALYLDCHLSVLDEVAKAVKYIMESLPEFFKAYGYDLGVPFPAECEAGPSMNDKRKVA